MIIHNECFRYQIKSIVSVPQWTAQQYGLKIVYIAKQRVFFVAEWLSITGLVLSRVPLLFIRNCEACNIVSLSLPTTFMKDIDKYVYM